MVVVGQCIEASTVNPKRDQEFAKKVESGRDARDPRMQAV